MSESLGRTRHAAYSATAAGQIAANLLGEGRSRVVIVKEGDFFVSAENEAEAEKDFATHQRRLVELQGNLEALQVEGEGIIARMEGVATSMMRRAEALTAIKAALAEVPEEVWELAEIARKVSIAARVDGSGPAAGTPRAADDFARARQDFSIALGRVSRNPGAIAGALLVLKGIRSEVERV